MLILSRKPNESIMIGDKIEISVIDIKGDQVKIGIKAPSDVKVYRQEVYQAIQQENIKATRTKPDILPVLDKLLIQKDKPLINNEIQKEAHPEKQSFPYTNEKPAKDKKDKL